MVACEDWEASQVLSRLERWNDRQGVGSNLKVRGLERRRREDRGAKGVGMRRGVPSSRDCRIFFEFSY